ncbi:hypothetical protein BEP19_00815 [Ammoniphilus oxalaticus]|uniref:YlbF family regulator n=1 Tax=Ammoniphilus oxalaticus TaxID=66863 RepID=A0A419SMS1_9BACL|nr:YlbF family regulator [Ammoniphilus oxalaticus]RKD25519.1 hypothetical protein BEP19_00815 [Ammoniphilus oxalaticus]
MAIIAQEIDRMTVLLQAQDIAEMILASEEMNEYITTKEGLQKDQHAQEQIQQFQKLKESFEEAQRFGTYHPDYKQINERVRTMRREIQLIPSVGAFRKAESALEELLYQVCRIIADGVSDAIKVPSDNPLYNLGGGCGSSGGCGSGGSCGCAG